MSKATFKIFSLALFASLFSFITVFIYQSGEENQKVPFSEASLVEARVVKTYAQKSKDDPKYLEAISELSLDTLDCELVDGIYNCTVMSKIGDVFLWDARKAMFILKAEKLDVDVKSDVMEKAPNA